MDIGVERWGDPVAAAARGRVTAADPEGWDTEKGVVIVEHIFPDRSIAYSLYGHVEQTDAIIFPRVGTCVERGQIIGSIGWPSRGRPHLHYEIRNFLPDDGGPGYVSQNPLLSGWYHPLDFTQLWRARLGPGYLASAAFLTAPNLPSVALDNGTFGLANDNTLQGVTGAGAVLWRVQTDGVITGMAALPGGRLAAHTTSGQVVVMQNGRYLALWQVRDVLDEPFLALGEALIFPQVGGGLAAFDASGGALWTLPPTGSASRLTGLYSSGDQIALGVRDDAQIVWRLVSMAGEVLYETRFDEPPVIAPDPTGGWLGLVGTQVKRFDGGHNQDLAAVAPVPGRTAGAVVDVVGNSYLYLGDPGSTLLSLDSTGAVRWRTSYPTPPAALPPLLHIGGGCLLYSLDMDGSLNVFSASDGELRTRVQLYAGGRQSGSPRARLLEVDDNERIRVNPGFLTTLWFDGWALAGMDPAECRLG